MDFPLALSTKPTDLGPREKRGFVTSDSHIRPLSVRAARKHSHEAGQGASAPFPSPELMHQWPSRGCRGVGPGRRFQGAQSPDQGPGRPDSRQARACLCLSFLIRAAGVTLGLVPGVIGKVVGGSCLAGPWMLVTTWAGGGTMNQTSRNASLRAHCAHRAQPRQPPCGRASSWRPLAGCRSGGEGREGTGVGSSRRRLSEQRASPLAPGPRLAALGSAAS